MMRPHSGFTLIELLIAIGILLILSGIAMQNYVEASIRARTARVRADHQTIATAVESYHVDHNAYPRMAHRWYSDPSFDYIDGVRVSGVLSRSITTPVAYLASALQRDPFAAGKADIAIDERLYTYQVVGAYVDREQASQFWPAARRYYGEWRLASIGPDQVFDHRFRNSAQLPYDPTNGLISLGNIWTSPRRPVDCPPIPDLLGPH